MAKDDEGERSEHRHVVVPRKRHRFSSAETHDLLTAAFVLLRYTRKGAEGIHPSLLAKALRLEATIIGMGDENGTDE